MAKDDNIKEFFEDLRITLRNVGILEDELYPYQFPDEIRLLKNILTKHNLTIESPLCDILKEIANALRECLNLPESELLNAQDFSARILEIIQGGSDEHEHSWVYDDTIGEDYIYPDCENDGYHIIPYRCESCGETKNEEETIPATGHSWGEWYIEYDPTEEEDGSLYRYCNNNDEHVDYINIPPLNYTDYTVDEYEADCEEDGKKIYYYTIDDQEFSFTIETDRAYGHDYIDGYCMTCGEKDPDYTPTCMLTFTNNLEGMYLRANGVTYTDSADIEVSEGDYVTIGVIGDGSAESASLFYACDISTSGDIEDIGEDGADYEIGEYEGGTVTTYISTSTSFCIYSDCSITLNPIEKSTLKISYPDYSNHSSTNEHVRIYSYPTASGPVADTLFNSDIITTSGTKTLVPTHDFVAISSGNYGHPVDQYISSISGLELVKIEAHTYSGNEGTLGNILTHIYRITDPDVVITLK